MQSFKSYIEELDQEEISEELTVAQRRKRSMAMRRNRAKLAMGRRRHSRRAADKERLNRRARREARNALYNRFTKGQDKSKMSAARKSELEKRAKRASGVVTRIQKRILPSVKRRDRGL
jgi:hypothetical protein